jgi:hypothetical protein
VLILYKRQSRLNLKLGDIYKEKNRKATVEGVAEDGMKALVYYGPGDFRVVSNRPIFYTSNDLVVKVNICHRCGTDVKYYYEGHKTIDNILLTELSHLLDLKGTFDPSNMVEYVHFLETGEENKKVNDELYKNLTRYWGTLTKEQRSRLASNLFSEWGRTPGHEMVGTIEKIGSNVKNLTKY